MELGNMMFGNSRGNFPVNRALQDLWCERMMALGFDSYGHHDWANDEGAFENGVFVVRPYYWGDCTCGYEAIEEAWSNAHSHTEACYQTAYRQISAEHKWMSPEFDAKVQALCASMGLSYPGRSAVHCTCDYSQQWEAFASANGHADDCRLVLPNFLFKPTGFRLDWYKYPLRDSYSSEPLTAAMIVSMFDACAASMVSA